MTPTNDPGVRRALDRVKRQALSLLDAVTDAEAALAGDPAALPVADKPLASEPMATADTFAAGDWVRPVGSNAWRQINNCAYCWCGDLTGPGGERVAVSLTDPVVVALTGPGDPIHLHKYDTLPHLTDAQFQRDCNQEQEDNAAGRLHRAEYDHGDAMGGAA